MTIRPWHAARAVSAAALASMAMGSLAACSSGSTAAAPSSAADPQDTGSTSATGTWTETGAYQTPGGRESVTVTLTAKDGRVTAVRVTGSGGTPNAQQYQAAFASGIAGAVVGKPLATLDVGAVSGSSLTGAGFDAAVEKIRADAS